MFNTLQVRAEPSHYEQKMIRSLCFEDVNALIRVILSPWSIHCAEMHLVPRRGAEVFRKVIIQATETHSVSEIDLLIVKQKCCSVLGARKEKQR